ncbi:MAG: SIMPL domain-containing protein, partial [Planctomycetota bacterium]|nr:SIMPL domain-containing protein [Planctomycetota bacterium]
MFRFLTIALLLVVGPWLPLKAIADEGNVRKISVTGTAVTCVTPDEIVWSITTTDNDPNLAKAKMASDQSAARVMAIRDKLKIEPDQLTAGRVQIQKLYDRDRNGNRAEFKEFSVRREFSIRQKNLDRFDDFLTEIVGGPVEGSFRYDSSRRYELRNQTGINAVKIAQKKAAAMADALGVRIGEPIEIRESVNAWGPTQVSNFAYNQQETGAADETQGRLVPDAIEIKISVQVDFAL